MRSRLHALVWVGLLGGVFVASCLARRDKPYTRITDDDAGAPDAKLLDGDVADVSPDALDLAPHAVLGIDPPHGPYAGGTLTMIRGNGFDSNARVWFDDVEVPKSSVTPIDPQRIQVVTPPGHAGAVDVKVQNGDAESTAGTLTGGFSYDRFFATPSSGPTSGGTIITVEGDGTSWDDQTRVEIDRQPCTELSVLSPQKLTCTTPASDAGAKVLTVITADDVSEDVLDGFTYGNSDNGFRGGLSGQPLSNQLTVLAFDNIEGQAIPGVSVLLGDDVSSGKVTHTDKNGVATFSGKLGSKGTVTLAVKCFQPVTFYDVAVDHVTAYLDPVLSPDCGSLGELPPGGGTPGVGSGVSGEVVWAPDEELKRQGWSNVPDPVGDSEKEVAYVFRLSDQADDSFRLPSLGQAITRDSMGSAGYKFYQSTTPGNFTMYALAGLEDDSGPSRVFTAYAMGILRGVAVKPGKTADSIFIQVDVPLDHALKLQLDPPTPGPRGPDRIRASVAIQVQDQGFAILPSGVSEHSLPGASDFSFVGVPPLVGTLAGSKYVLGARAVTGAGGGEPLSVIGTFVANSSAQSLDLGGFVPLPVVTTPAPNTKWDLRTLGLKQAKNGQSVDLTVVRVQAGGGLYEWTLVAPGPRDSLALPDLSQLAPEGALPVGSMIVTTTLAHIDGFDYGNLRYRQLSERGWNAYATDNFLTQH
ncbi:MAG TPA: IPT/TIG domain-containing protein [Polyangiaceae bacterium]|nr:IPT/TIG domain-containing protein [Polyangiaceae bacterium]